MPSIKSRVVHDRTARLGWSEREGLEIFGRYARENQRRVCPEAESAVVRRLAQHHAAGSTLFPENAQGLKHEARAHAAALIRRQNRNGSNSAPPGQVRN